ncbi:MAG TPA: TonB-dependent receptor [Gammaproteobacteria bacterium]
MGYEKKYHTWALVYVVCGMSLGIVMAVSHFDIRYLAPTQVLFVGFVLSLVYGLIHHLWLISAHLFHSLHSLYLPSVMQYLLHIRQAGALTVFSALLLAYGNVFLDEQTQPVHAAAAITLLMVAMTLLDIVRSVTPEKA